MTLTLIIGGALLLLFIIVLIGRRSANRNIVQYTVDEVSGQLKSGNVVMLDVRTQGERAARAIPKSLHIPLHELAGRLDELKKYRGKTIVCYCQSGSRSLAAADQLGRAGYTAASMRGGIMAWDRKR